MIAAPASTSVSIDIQVFDDSGLPVTGLVAATLPAIYWSLAGPAASTAITLSDLALITTAWTSGGVKERAGNAGVYRLDLPNAALANAGSVRIFGEASGKHVVAETITVGQLPAQVNAYANNQDPWTLLAAGAIAGTPTAGTVQEALLYLLNMGGRRGTAQGGSANTIQLDAGASATDGTYVGDMVRLPFGLGAGQFATITAYNGATKTATIRRLGGTGGWTTAPDNTTGFIIYPQPLANVYLWKGATPNDLASGRLDASVGAMGTDVLNAAALAADAVSEIANGLLASQPSESYAADGTAPTVAQFLFQMWSILAEKVIAGTTMTTKRLDGSTTAMSFTLNDGANPTSITRSA